MISPGGSGRGADQGFQVVDQGSGRAAVRLELRPQGRDWLLLVTGGQAHVGAVAVAAPAPAETRVAVLPPHREGPLARECAEAVARAAGTTCAAVAGIHQDDATAAEIAAIVANVRLALGTIIDRAFGPGPEEG